MDTWTIFTTLVTGALMGVGIMFAGVWLIAFTEKQQTKRRNIEIYAQDNGMSYKTAKTYFRP